MQGWPAEPASAAGLRFRSCSSSASRSLDSRTLLWLRAVIVFLLFTMASLLTTPVEAGVVSAAIANMDSELVFLFESNKVPADIVAKFGVLGYTDMETFAHMEDSPAQVREIIKSDITLNPGGSPAHRSMMARLLAVWTAAGKRTAKQKEGEAAQRAGDLPRHLPKGKHLEVVRAYAQAHKELKDKECPAPSYLEWRYEQVEDGELKAESLASVINK